MWTYKSHQKFQKVYLGLPVPDHMIVGCHWTLTSSLMKKHYQAFEIHKFRILLVELLSSESYCALIHTDLMDLENSANTDRATLVKLAMLLPKNEFRVWDPEYRWEPRAETPSNITVWTTVSTKEVEEWLLAMLEVWH